MDAAGIHRAFCVTLTRMLPRLKPSLVLLWRDARTLQLGLPPGRCALITDADAGVVTLLDQLDGRRTLDDVIAAADSPLPAAVVRDLVNQLIDAGLVDDDAAPTTALHRLPAAERARLGHDLQAWSVTTTHPQGARGALAARRGAWVDLRTTGRLGFACAQLLAAAGVGRITMADPSVVGLDDVAPLGPRTEHVGQRTSRALHALLAEQGSAARCIPRNARPADVTVVAPAGAVVDLDIVDDLMRRGAAHLPVVQRGGGFVLGPFVVPGRSACVRCVEHLATESDPTWPAVVAQLRTPSLRTEQAVAAHDTVLGTVAAGIVALQVLAWIDHQEPPTLVDSIGHLTLPHGRFDLVGTSAHPACGCTWPGGTDVPGKRPAAQHRTMAA